MTSTALFTDRYELTMLDAAIQAGVADTPATFSIYILLEVFRWLESQGGLAAIEKRNTTKAKLVYDAIDNSNGFYKGTVSNIDQRSHMNVTYLLSNDSLTDEFIKTAAKNDVEITNRRPAARAGNDPAHR